MNLPNAPVVWIVNNYAQEPNGAGGTRHFSLAKKLKQRGFDPYIIAASTVHNQTKQRLREGEDVRIDVINDIPFVWLRSPVFSSNGLRRLWNMLDFAMQVPKRKLIKHIPKPDVVIGSSPDPFAAFGAQRAAAKYRAKFIYEVRDFWPLSLIELGKLHPLHPLALTMGFIERFLCKRSNRVISVQKHAGLYLASRRVPENKFVHLPNGIDLSLFPEPSSKEPGDDFVFMYFGAHGNGNGLENILFAMKTVEANDPTAHIHLRLIGDGPLKEALKAQAAVLGLKRVSFEAPIPKRDIPILAATADALVFNVVDMPVLRYGISANKLFDYLAAKRPVIFACNASDDLVAAAHAGLSVPAGDHAALAKAMLKLAAMDSATLKQMGENGRNHVETMHSFEALGETLTTMLQQVLKE